MSSKHNGNRHRKIISVLFQVLAITVIAYSIFWAGYDAAHHWYQSMGFNLIVAAFWLPIIWFWQAGRMLDRESDMLDDHIEHLEKFKGVLDELAEARDQEIEAAELAHDAHICHLIVTKGGGRAPNKRERARIVKLFSERHPDFTLEVKDVDRENGEYVITAVEPEEPTSEGFDAPGGGDSSYHDRTAGRLAREAASNNKSDRVKRPRKKEK